MAILIFYSYTSEAYALGVNITYSEQEILAINELDLEEQINYIEDELSKMDYTIEQSIKDNIALYQNLIEEGNLNYEEIIKANELIDTLEQQLEEYKEYKNEKYSISLKYDNYEKKAEKYNSNTKSVITTDPYKVIRATIGAVNAWFSAKGYVLASELLTYSLKNKNKNAVYSPINGSRVTKSPVFSKLKQKPYRSTGTDRFPNSGTTIQKDLYYAIHEFRWERASSGYLIIRDYYDFEPNKYSGIESIAINNMYKAQKAGIITPYNISISK